MADSRQSKIHLAALNVGMQMETSGNVESEERRRDVAVICSISSAEPRSSPGRISSCDITRREDRSKYFEDERQSLTPPPSPRIFWLWRPSGPLPPRQHSRHARQTHDSERWKKSV